MYLRNVMYRAMQEKQNFAVASNAKVLMKLVGLEIKVKSLIWCFGTLDRRFETYRPDHL